MWFRLLLAVLILSILFSAAYCTQSMSNESLQEQLLQAGEIKVDYWVFLSGSYSPFDLNVRQDVVVNIILPQPPSATPFDITFRSISFTLKSPLNLPSGATYDYDVSGSPPSVTLTIHLPANISYSSIKLEGSLYGESAFWRNSVTVEAFNFSTSAYDFTSRLVIVPPSASRVLRVYSRAYPTFNYQKANVEGYESIVISGGDFENLQGKAGLAILYESNTWAYYAFFTMFLTILVFFILSFYHHIGIIPPASRFKKVGVTTTNLISKYLGKLPQKPINILSRSFHTLVAVFRRFLRRVLALNSSKLLAIFIICGLLMTSLSFLAGPDPRVKVYVFAQDETTAHDISQFIAEHGGVTVTSLEELGDLRSLADLGVFSAVIVGNFVPPPESDAELKIYPALDNIVNENPQYSIIVLQIHGTSWYADGNFSSTIYSRYSDKTTTVTDLNSFDAAFRQIKGRENTLGIDISPATHLKIAALVGLLSFIIVFLGLAFLACKLTEAGKKLGVRGFPEAIAYAVFYFVFTEMIYIVCSVLLAMPLALHTSRLEAKVTAVSLLGFGGGSNPRMFAGIAGFLFGAFLSLKQGVKLDKLGFLAFLFLAFFIIIDPLTSGVIFHEFVLLNTIGPNFGTAVQTESYIRDFLANIGNALGGWASPIYGIQTGIILFFAGAIPFCLFAKLQRSTATILLFISALCVGTGGIRVGDMNPWVTVASIFPGIATGFFVVVVFSLISVAEAALRKKIGGRRS
jgi:hypothetical protein